MKEERIRPCADADLDALLAIESAWPTAPGWTRKHFEAELASKTAVLLVLEQDGEPAGYAGYWRVPPEAQITTVAVHPGRAGRGLGRWLLEALLAAARGEGLRRVTLEVSAGNKPALRLYERTGFQVVGRRAKFYNDGSDAILMDLNLP